MLLTTLLGETWEQLYKGPATGKICGAVVPLHLYFQLP